MSKGIEMMVRTLLSATGVDVEAAKKEALTRIEGFEYNLAVLNATLKSNDANLKAICEHLGVTYTAPEFIPDPAMARDAAMIEQAS